MAYFPQLSATAHCQFPISRKRSFRTLTNTLEEGSRIVLTDPAATQVRWTLTYSGLTDIEAASLQSFFEASEGRLHTFAFADPAANLLMWSDDLTKVAWQSSALLQVLGDRLSNMTAGNLTLVQTVPVPGAWTCCWSVSLKSDTPSLVTLTRDSIALPVHVTGTWQRFQLSTANTSNAATSDFGLIIPAGTAIHLTSPQVEAQASASTFIPTLNNSGVYPAARFDSDVLDIVADAPNSNHCTLSLMSYTQ